MGRRPMARKAKKVLASSLRETAGSGSRAPMAASAVRAAAPQACDDCRAETAFQAWHSFDLPAAFNMLVNFGDWNLIPKGKRAVIELVTAQILVPAKEWIRLRM